MLFSPLCSGVGRAQESYEDSVLALLSVMAQDLQGVKADGSSSEYSLEQILYAVNNPVFRADISSITSDVGDIDRAVKANLTYLPVISGHLYDLKSAVGHIGTIKDYSHQFAVINSNLLKLARPAGDELAGNPWWATNSAFTMTRYRLDEVYPFDDNIRLQSFPEFMSRWSARLTRPTNGRAWTSSQAKANWWKQFGTEFSTESYNDESPYTWFDFVADAIRSNFVLQASLGGITNAPTYVDTDVTAAVDDGSTDTTNGIPDMVVEQMDVTGVEAGLELVDADAVGDMFPDSFTGGDPEFVVFSGGQYGAVTVPEVRGSLAIPDNVARYLRGVAMWLWRVALFVGCFVILRQEVAFWSTLGGSASDA